MCVAPEVLISVQQCERHLVVEGPIVLSQRLVVALETRSGEDKACEQKKTTPATVAGRREVQHG